jgi:hypothetical protein
MSTNPITVTERQTTSRSDIARDDDAVIKRHRGGHPCPTRFRRSITNGTCASMISGFPTS